MSNFITRRITVTRLQHGVANLMFSIDTPRTEEVKLFASSMLKLSGWALYNKKSVEIVIRHHHGEWVFKCSSPRPDVLKNIKIDAEEKCGFLIPITFSGSFDVGFIVDDGVAWGARVDINPAAKVQFGNSGHLFLDNDTNNSVAQFTGQELISDESISLWAEYFSTLNSFFGSSQTKHILTLAPSKELVLPQYYPHKKADITPVEQFLVHFHKEKIIYPKEALSDAGNSTYSKQDTHWTEFGAGIAANHILGKIGVPLKDPFPFKFRIIKATGDLGVKISKSTIQDLMIADFSPAMKLCEFDNKINNRGRVKIYQNPHAVIKQNIILFGDSFSNSLAPYFVNAFSRVVHVLSGASVDYDILKHEQPDLVICELTTRFLLQAPESNYSVSQDCKRKILAMSASERADFFTSLRESDESYSFYVQKTIADLDEASLQSLAG